MFDSQYAVFSGVDRIKEIIIEEYLDMEDKKMAKQSMDVSLGMLCIEDDLFAYELGILKDSYFPCVEQPYDDLENGDLDIYEPRQCYDEYERMFVEAVILIDSRLVKLIDITLEQWLDLKFRDHKQVDKEISEGIVSTWLIRSYRKQFEEYMEIKRRLEVNGVNNDVECDPTNGDDEEVLTYDELSNLEEENLYEGNEIAEVFRIETDIFLFETPLCKEFKEFNHLLQIDVDVLIGDLLGFKTYDDYKNICRLVSKVDMLNGPLVIRGKMDINHTWINNDNDAIQANQELFDDHQPMEDDDDADIGDLDGYLIQNDAPYYVNEEEERFKERRSKLLGIPYKKPPTFKSVKFEVSIRCIHYHRCGVLTALEVLNANEESGGMHIIWNLMCVVHAGIQTLFIMEDHTVPGEFSF
ncbi:hypothetical protein Tco_1152441 [Tanacetum coccineum]